MSDHLILKTLHAIMFWRVFRSQIENSYFKFQIGLAQGRFLILSVHSL